MSMLNRFVSQLFARSSSSRSTGQNGRSKSASSVHQQQVIKRPHPFLYLYGIEKTNAIASSTLLQTLVKANIFQQSRNLVQYSSVSGVPHVVSSMYQPRTVTRIVSEGHQTYSNMNNNNNNNSNHVYNCPSPAKVPSRFRLFHLLVAASSFLFAVGASSDNSSEGEVQRMKQRLEKYGFVERPVAPDGNCMMRAISDQLGGSEAYYPAVRKTIADWLSRNADFVVQDPSASTEQKEAGSPSFTEQGARLSDFLDTDQFPTWDSYCKYMGRDKTWGDHLALVAASEAYQAKIYILSSVDTQGGKSEPVTVIEPKSGTPKRTIYLSHWHENHYNSLQKVNNQSKL